MAGYIRPHLGSSRKIHPGQKIHSSLLLDDGASTDYTPMARPVDDDFLFWSKLQADKFKSDWLEIDLYQATETVLRDYIDGHHDMSFRILQKIATSGEPGLRVLSKIFLTLECR